MSKKKKIALCVLFSVLCVIFVYLTFEGIRGAILLRSAFNNWKDFKGQYASYKPIYVKDFVNCLLRTVFYAVNIILLIVLIVKTSNAKHFTRYTYEEYKAYRDKKKAENQEKKKAKLQKQLQEIEKTE